MKQDNESDPFEIAATVARSEIELPDTTVSLEDGRATENESTEEEVLARPRRPRGRPRGRSRRRRTSSPRTRAAGATSDSNADGERPTTVARSKVEAAPPAVVLAPIPPEKVIPLLRQIDKTFVRLLHTQPLDEQELKDGAEACAPVLDYYAPLFLSKPWAGAAIWGAMVYTPRVVEVYDKRKQGGGRKSETFSSATPASSDPTATRETVVGH